MPKHVREYVRLGANRVCSLLVAAALVFSCAGLYRGVSIQAAARCQSGEELTVSASFQDKQVAADEPIEFRLNRPLGRDEGTLAIIIGQSDLTGLFAVLERGLRYDAKALPLPSGESEVTVYLVSPGNEWREVARFTLRVGKEEDRDLNGALEQAARQTRSQEDAAQTAKQPRMLGFEKLDFNPSISLSVNSQPAQSNFPATARPDRATFTDLNLQMSFKSEIERGLFASESQFDFVGTSFRQSALRFGQLGERAPRVDLSSYLMQFKIGKVRYQAGHFTFGSSRHLMNGFSSRGLMVSVPLSSRADLAASAMNGTSITGYSNFFGLDKRRHRLVSGAVGFEFLPERPGGLRAEVSLLD
ncbi:MAG TPA: hypothetical protein VNO14_08255, partial [Blastocatellia bacterium]|nr:hypothetical protein [Blastocatellia bacterium]